MQIGQKVTYQPFGKVERGIVKSLSDAKHVFVVYHCGGNWERYFDYTAARTEIIDLTPGWVEDAPQETKEQNGHNAQHLNMEAVVSQHGICKVCHEYLNRCILCVA